MLVAGLVGQGLFHGGEAGAGDGIFFRLELQGAHEPKSGGSVFTELLVVPADGGGGKISIGVMTVRGIVIRSGGVRLAKGVFANCCPQIA